MGKYHDMAETFRPQLHRISNTIPLGLSKEEFDRQILDWQADRERYGDVQVGDEVLAYSRGAVRAGVAVAIGRTNLQFAYVTPTGLVDEVKHGWTPLITVKAVKLGHLHAVRTPRITVETREAKLSDLEVSE